jgi:hypothetical protein
MPEAASLVTIDEASHEVGRNGNGPRFAGLSGSSPGWTRTNNPPVNSRMLCQLSYRGSAGEL